MTQSFYRNVLLRRTVALMACGLPVAWAAPALAASLATKGVTHTTVSIPVAGRVTGADGKGLPGVTVLVRGTSIGTATGADGAFTLNAPEGSTLLFSYVGFESQVVALTTANAGNLSITLRESVQGLNEVVVVGYGTQERQDVTGAIASVSGRDVASQPVADPLQALQGRAAGVTVTSNSGAPGGAGGTAVRIRGLTSAGNNSPLYVVDGFPLSSDLGEAQVNSISPTDIESIDILKDASATAIYGIRAANGVVLITTKHGKSGTATVNVDGYRGLQQAWRKLDLLNSEQYAVIYNESLLAAGKTINSLYANPKSLGEGTDWQAAIFRPRAQVQNYSLSATGGSDKGRYAVSGSYFQQDGTIIGSFFERFTVRANGEVTLNKYFKVGNNLSFTHQRDRQVFTDNSEFGVLNNVIEAPPTLPVYRADGTYYEAAPGDPYGEPNPVAQAIGTNSKNTRDRITGTFYAEVEPLKGLRFRTNVGGDLVFDNGSSFKPILRNVPSFNTATANSSSAYTPSFLIENTATYDRTLAERHHLTVLVGQSAQVFTYNSLGAGRSGYLNNDLVSLNAGPLTPVPSNYGSGLAPAQDRYAGYFARVNYEFSNKYLLTATGRYDGTSQFGSGNKFGFFPGASLGWRISEEDFLKGIPTISNLKLRAGFGRTGNPLNAGRFAYLAGVNTGISYILGTGTQGVVLGAAPTRAQNLSLQWENNYQANVGVDLGLFDNRLEFTVDVYERRSPNLISYVAPYQVTGTYEYVPTNAISAYNRGLDVAINSRNLVSGSGLNWTTALTFSTFQNRISDLNVAYPFNGIVDRTGVAITRSDRGQAFGAFYGYQAEGLFQNQSDIDRHAVQQTGTAPGDIKFRDINGDGRITDDDRVFIGSPIPKFTYGLNNTLTYKGFDLNVYLQGSQGNQIYNVNRTYLEGGLYGTSNSSTRVLGRWTGEGTSTDVPRAVNGDPNQNLRVSSYYIEDGSYLRIKVLTLGYNFAGTMLTKFTAKTLRVYVSSQNLLTLTKYTGFDPEVGAAGVDRGIYPQARTFLVGANIGF